MNIAQSDNKETQGTKRGIIFMKNIVYYEVINV